MNVALVPVSKLRNVPVREIVRALERDGFSQSSKSRSSSRGYIHPDGRKVFIHYHRPNDTIPRGTLKNIIDSARWTEDDAKRLGMI